MPSDSAHNTPRRLRRGLTAKFKSASSGHPPDSPGRPQFPTPGHLNALPSPVEIHSSRLLPQAMRSREELTMHMAWASCCLRGRRLGDALEYGMPRGRHHLARSE